MQNALHRGKVPAGRKLNSNDWKFSLAVKYFWLRTISTSVRHKTFQLVDCYFVKLFLQINSSLLLQILTSLRNSEFGIFSWAEKSLAWETLPKITSVKLNFLFDEESNWKFEVWKFHKLLFSRQISTRVCREKSLSPSREIIGAINILRENVHCSREKSCEKF